MAQYSANPTVVEAYVIGDANIPAFFTEALTDRKIVQYLKSTPNGVVLHKTTVQTSEGIKEVATGEAVILNADGELDVLSASAFATAYLLDNANLTSVLTLSDTTPTGAGTSATVPAVWDISVANEVATLGLANIVVGTDATKNLYTDATFETEITGANTIALTAGAATAAYIKVTSKHGTLVRYYKVNITRAAA